MIRRLATAIRRLATAIRRLTRRQPTPPSEPHSPHAEGEYCWTHNTWGGPAAAEVREPGGPEPTAFDRLILGPDAGATPVKACPAVLVPDMVERQRPPSLPTGGTR